jgi:hypothetical protein
MNMFRFFYLNSYAFLLLVLGALILILPLNIFLLILKILTALWCVIAAFAIFIKWKEKMRKIPILAGRNKKEIRPDTFKKLSQTLCGELVIHLVLADLRKTETYRLLSAEEWKAAKRKAFGKRAKTGRKGKETVVDSINAQNRP